MIIRQAGPDELARVLDWRMKVLHTVFEIADEDPLPEMRLANEQYYKEHLGKDHLAFFAEEDGKWLASGAICLQQEMPSPDNPNGRCAYLMNICTDPAYRHQGIAHALVQTLIEEARRLDIPKIYLETTEAGKPLYESLGFHDYPDLMKLKEE